MNSTYKKCLTSGIGKCWFCDKNTNMIFDNGNEEFFVDLSCFIRHIKNFKGKSRIERKLCVKMKKTRSGGLK